MADEWITVVSKKERSEKEKAAVYSETLRTKCFLLANSQGFFKSLFRKKRN